MNCPHCPNIIPLERCALGYKTCVSCAELRTKRYKGDMNYAHKTAPTLMVMSAEEHSNYRRYVPYGKHTGRGSGNHRMSRPTVKLQ